MGTVYYPPLGKGTIEAVPDGSGIVITSPNGATLTLAGPAGADTGCSGPSVEVVDGLCVAKAPEPVLCEGESVEVSADGRCAAKAAAVDAATAGYIQAVVESTVKQIMGRVSTLEAATAVQNASIESLTAKFHPKTQWQCGQIVAYAGACRAHVSTGSAFLVAVEKGVSGTEACERALCGRSTGGTCSDQMSPTDTVPFCYNNKLRTNDEKGCHFRPSCVNGYQHDGYLYGNECGAAYAASGYACCAQADNAGPGPLSGIVLDNSRRLGGAFTDVLTKCPMFDTECELGACKYY